MRIIGGLSKGRLLKSPRGLRVRPTSNKVKEALYSILANRVRGSRILDLFAGTGAIGLEALSRGADWVEFVEQDPLSLRILKDNIRHCGFATRTKIHRLNILKFLKNDRILSGPFDIVFADPPYHTGILRRLLPLLSRGDIMAPSGIMVIEHFHKLDLPESIGSYKRSRQERYGDTLLSFYPRGLER